MSGNLIPRQPDATPAAYDAATLAVLAADVRGHRAPSVRHWDGPVANPRRGGTPEGRVVAEPSLTEQMRQMTERLRALAGFQHAVVESARRVQEAVLFGDHPELASLDDELDILYRGQL